MNQDKVFIRILDSTPVAIKKHIAYAALELSKANLVKGIHFYRMATGCGLKEAKDIVEALVNTKSSEDVQRAEFEVHVGVNAYKDIEVPQYVAWAARVFLDEKKLATAIKLIRKAIDCDLLTGKKLAESIRDLPVSHPAIIC